MPMTLTFNLVDGETVVINNVDDFVEFVQSARCLSGEGGRAEVTEPQATPQAHAPESSPPEEGGANG